MKDSLFFRIRQTRKDDERYELIFVPVGRILPNPAKFRRTVNDGGIIRLSDSIMRYGILEPLTVRAVDDGESKKGKKAQPIVYELISGERRLRAAKMAGITEVPCVVIAADDRRAAEMTITENVTREGLTFFEEASAMESLIDVYGLTQEETAGVFGVQRPVVSAKLRLLRLTPAEKTIISGSGVTERHARALLKICDSERRLEVLRETVRLRLSVSQTEELVDRVLCPAEDKGGKKKRITIKDTRVIYNTIDKAIDSIERTGVSVEKERRESEDAVEFVFRIKKPSLASDLEPKTVITTPAAV